MIKLVCLLLLLITLCTIKGQEPNPPRWPSNVYILDPASPGNTQTIVDRIYSENGGHTPAFHGQFSNSRYALLFKPGNHAVTVNVGYYTSVLGLGTKPTDTNIRQVQCENGDFDYTGGALSNFWRSAENFATGTMLWAASQACPLRRLNVNGNLNLFQYNGGCCAGYASGGFLADSIITGNSVAGSQQQYFTRNSNIGRWEGSVWNMVFVGNTGGIPASHCGNTGPGAYTTIPTTPIIAEKPYISIDGSGRFHLRVPRVETGKVGPTSNYDNVDNYDFSRVYVATASDSAATINQKLASGLNVVLSPGIYYLTDSITITRPNTTLLGIGWATLVADNGRPAIVVDNVDGVRVAGILLQAGTAPTSALLNWGTSKNPGNPQNPGVLSDVFARVGGPNNPAQNQVQADIMVQINSGNVIFDGTWLWRADHGIAGEVVNSQNPNKHGLVVNGDNVITYGLAVEHQLNDLVVWNGENGRTYFFQAELPYDVTQQNFGNPGYVGYRVASNVQVHHAYGVGVYIFFRDYDVTTQNGFATGNSPNIVFVAPMTKYLSGKGEIVHVINGRGSSVSQNGNQISYVC